MPAWYTGGQQDTVGLDAGGDDIVDAVVIADAAQAPGVQAVVAGHAGVDVGSGLERLELHAGGFHLLADGLQAQRGVAVFAGTSVDGYDLHIDSLQFLFGSCLDDSRSCP